MREKRKEHPTNEKEEESRGKRKGGRVSDILHHAKYGSDTDSDEPSYSPLSSQQPKLLQNGEDSPHTPSNLAPPRNTTAQLTPPTTRSQTISRAYSLDQRNVRKANNAMKETSSNCQEKDKPKEGEMIYEGFNVGLEVISDEEYVLRIKRRKIECSTDEDVEKGAKQMAQSAGMLLGQSKMLKDKGKKQLEHYVQYMTQKSASKNKLSFSSVRDDLV